MTAITVLANAIATSAPDAKPLTSSWSFYGYVVIAAGWAAHNLVAYFDLGQSLEATIATGIVGGCMFGFGMIATMRRRGIKVPVWIADIAEAVVADAPRSES